MTTPPQPVAPSQSDSALTVTSMVLGALSLTGPGILFGLPAIVLAAIALKKRTRNKNLAIAGLVTGIISTVISVALLILFFWAMAWIGSHPQEFQEFEQRQPEQSKPLETLQT